MKAPPSLPPPSLPPSLCRHANNCDLLLHHVILDGAVRHPIVVIVVPAPSTPAAPTVLAVYLRTQMITSRAHTCVAGSACAGAPRMLLAWGPARGGRASDLLTGGQCSGDSHTACRQGARSRYAAGEGLRRIRRTWEPGQGGQQPMRPPCAARPCCQPPLFPSRRPPQMAFGAPRNSDPSLSHRRISQSRASG